jgi:2-haloacid dehalogenase
LFERAHVMFARARSLRANAPHAAELRHSSVMNDLDFSAFRALTFDCYGTIIDWERGILAAIRPAFDRRRIEAQDDDLLEAFGAAEAAIEAGPYKRYREVLGEVLVRIARDHGFEPAQDEIDAFGGSVGEWPPFEDSVDALRRLATRFRLGVITNCDDDLFAATSRRLGLTFDPVVTAQQVGSYKPNLRNFEVMFERLGLPHDQILHVAQSLFHDHVPAKELGLSTVWVDRRQGKGGGGATKPATASPDLVVPDLRTLAERAGV